MKYAKRVCLYIQNTDIPVAAAAEAMAVVMEEAMIKLHPVDMEATEQQIPTLVGGMPLKLLHLILVMEEVRLKLEATIHNLVVDHQLQHIPQVFFWFSKMRQSCKIYLLFISILGSSSAGYSASAYGSQAYGGGYDNTASYGGASYGGACCSDLSLMNACIFIQMYYLYLAGGGGGGGGYGGDRGDRGDRSGGGGGGYGG